MAESVTRLPAFTAWLVTLLVGFAARASPPEPETPHGDEVESARDDVESTGSEPTGAESKDARAARRARRKQRRAVNEQEHREHRVAPFPVLKTEPGVGLTFGARGRYVWRKHSDRLNRITLDAVARVSVNKVQRYEFRLRMRDLAGHNEVFDVNFEFQDDPVFTHVGVANHSALTNRGIQRERFEVHRFSLGPDLNYQHPVWTLQPRGYLEYPGYLRIFVGWKLQYDNIRAGRNTLLAAELPEQLGRGRRGSYYAGVGWDSRDNDWSPKSGSFHDVSIAAAGPWAGGDRTWGRVNGSLRHYRRVGFDEIVFAGQLLGEYQFGDVPLVPLGEFSGLVFREGLGGAYTGRGYFRRRFIGDLKVAASAELRVEPHEFKTGRWTLTPAFKPFVDLGYVADSDDGTGRPRLRHSYGGSIYFVWDKFEVLRVDAAASPEGFALLISADHAF